MVAFAIEGREVNIYSPAPKELSLFITEHTGLQKDVPQIAAV